MLAKAEKQFNEMVGSCPEISCLWLPECNVWRCEMGQRMSIVHKGDAVLTRVTLSSTQPYLCSSCTDLTRRKHSSKILQGRRYRKNIVFASASVRQSHCSNFSKPKWQSSQEAGMKEGVFCFVFCMSWWWYCKMCTKQTKTNVQIWFRMFRMWSKPKYSTLISLRLIWILICVWDCCPVGFFATTFTWKIGRW